MDGILLLIQLLKVLRRFVVLLLRIPVKRLGIRHQGLGVRA